MPRHPRPALPLTLGILALLGLVVSCADPDPERERLDIQRWSDTRTIAGDSLISLLGDRHQGHRKAAALALGRIGHPDALRPLIEHLEEDRHPEVRATAAFALGILGVPEAATALVRRLDREPDANALSEIALALGRLEAPGAADALRPLLESLHPRVREQTVEALALLADTTSVDALLEATADPLASVRWRAAYALEKIPGETAWPRLQELLMEENPLVRRAAVRSLGRLEAKVAVEPIAELLADAVGDWQLRVEAARALGLLGGERAVEALAAALEDSVFHVRTTALNGLGRLRARTMVHLVLDRIHDPVVDVRAAAYDALADCLEGRALENLKGGLQDRSEIVAATCLRRLGDGAEPEAVELLLAALGEDRPGALRAAAMEGLTAAGEATPLFVFRQALQDDDFVVATLAAAALAERRDLASVPLLIQAYHAREGAGSVDVRWQILQSLGTLEAQEAEALLRGAMADEDDLRLRLAAREALAAILPDAEAAALPEERVLRADVRPVERSPKQPPVVGHSQARQLILHTPRGRVLIDLFGADAPQTVESFARLADRGFFDGLDFHRVVPNFVVQGGDPLGSGWGDAGYTLRSEWTPRRYERGTVGVAHSGKDTGSCQFFLCHAAQPHLNARYTIFGEVVQGMEVVDQLQRGDTFRMEVVWREEL